MDKIVELFSRAKVAIRKSIGDQDILSWALGRIFMALYIIGEYTWWYLGFPFKRWECVKCDADQLHTLKDQPAVIVVAIKNLQARYAPHTKVTVMVYPSLTSNYETWTFSVRGEKLRISTVTPDNWKL